MASLTKARTHTSAFATHCWHLAAKGELQLQLSLSKLQTPLCSGASGKARQHAGPSTSKARRPLCAAVARYHFEPTSCQHCLDLASALHVPAPLKARANAAAQSPRILPRSYIACPTAVGEAHSSTAESRCPEVGACLSRHPRHKHTVHWVVVTLHILEMNCRSRIPSCPAACAAACLDVAH